MNVLSTDIYTVAGEDGGLVGGWYVKWEGRQCCSKVGREKERRSVGQWEIRVQLHGEIHH